MQKKKFDYSMDKATVILILFQIFYQIGFFLNFEIFFYQNDAIWVVLTTIATIMMIARLPQFRAKLTKPTIVFSVILLCILPIYYQNQSTPWVFDIAHYIQRLLTFSLIPLVGYYIYLNQNSEKRKNDENESMISDEEIREKLAELRLQLNETEDIQKRQLIAAEIEELTGLL